VLCFNVLWLRCCVMCCDVMCCAALCWSYSSNLPIAWRCVFLAVQGAPGLTYESVLRLPIFAKTPPRPTDFPSTQAAEAAPVGHHVPMSVPVSPSQPEFEGAAAPQGETNESSAEREVVRLQQVTRGLRRQLASARQEVQVCVCMWCPCCCVRRACS